MDLDDLRVFRAVVEEGGVLPAARKLHRVQSGVTTRIKQLEASLGVPLFFRHRQRLHLSPKGEMLKTYADRLLTLCDEARAAISGAPPRGTLRLGALESTTASRLPSILSAFHAAYPDVSVELTTGTNDALTNAVASRKIEAAFVAENPADPGLAFLPLFSEKLVLISSLRHEPITRPRDVAQDSLIAFPTGCAYRRILQRWLGETVARSVRVLELASYHAIVACVASGTGVALVPEAVLQTVRTSEIRRHPLPKIHADVVTPLIWRRSEESAALLALKKILVETQWPVGGPWRRAIARK